MQKLKSTYINILLSLTIIVILMSAILGFAYIKTKTSIEKANREKDMASITSVLPEYDNDLLKDTLTFDGINYYLAYKDSVYVGCAVKSTSLKGYNSKISIMVGFLSDETINKITVIEQNETKGFGSRITNNKFISQFLNKDLTEFDFTVKDDGGDVDAVTGATVSSRAFCDALKTAYISYQKNVLQNEVNDGVCNDSCMIINASIFNEVLPVFDNNPIETKMLNKELEVYTCKKGDKIVGYAIKSYSNGFASVIWTLTGFLPDGTICKTIVLKQEETQGYGTQIVENKFLTQFSNQNPDKFKITVIDDGGSVEAVTGATISSRAFCDAIQKACKACKSIKK